MTFLKTFQTAGFVAMASLAMIAPAQAEETHAYEELAWEDLMPEGEEERLLEMYAQQQQSLMPWAMWRKVLLLTKPFNLARSMWLMISMTRRSSCPVTRSHRIWPEC